jgi:hypothetical protein
MPKTIASGKDPFLFSFRVPQISDETVSSFMAVYEEIYKKSIAPDEAREMARRVLTLYSLLARPVSCEVKSLRRQKEKRRKKDLALG